MQSSSEFSFEDYFVTSLSSVLSTNFISVAITTGILAKERKRKR